MAVVVVVVGAGGMPVHDKRGQIPGCSGSRSQASSAGSRRRRVLGCPMDRMRGCSDLRECEPAVAAGGRGAGLGPSLTCAHHARVPG